MHYQYLIAMDLDGTLYNDQKQITPRTRIALENAYHAGAAIVPATGRMNATINDVIEALPFIQYTISINGAAVTDRFTNERLYQDEIPFNEAIELFKILDTMPAVYDCFQDGWGYIKESFVPQLENYIPDPFARNLVRSTRTYIPNFIEEMTCRGKSIQKAQAFFESTETRNRILPRLQAAFPNLQISYALSTNMEFNSKTATKGNAVRFLANMLQIPKENVFVFGDSANDISMFSETPMNFVMANGTADAIAHASFITESNNNDGIAVVIEEKILTQFRR